MYLTIRNGICRAAEKEEAWQEGTEFLCLLPLCELEEAARLWGLESPVSEEGDRACSARCEVLEACGCIRLMLPDFENITNGRGSVLLYLEKGRAFFFAEVPETAEEMLAEGIGSLGDRLTLSGLVYSFFESMTKGEGEALEKLEGEILKLEQSIITGGSRDFVAEILSLRKRLLVLKRFSLQFLDVLEAIAENKNDFFEAKELRSFRMLAVRTERRRKNVLELGDSLSQLRESYEAEVDISLNTTMRFFTVVTTIFLPLSLLTGWYGMNFPMPEFSAKHGYTGVCVISVLIAAAAVLFFRKKKWF